MNLSSGEDNEDNGRTTRPILADEVVQALIPFIAGGAPGHGTPGQELDALEFSASTRLNSVIAGSLAEQLRGELRALRLGAWRR